MIYLSMRMMIKKQKKYIVDARQGFKSVDIHVERSLLILSHRPICVLA